MRPAVFTDLDGSLLDLHTYRPGPARPALQRLIEAGLTVVFCSTKTEAEQSALAAELSVAGPRVVENGAAVVLSGETLAVFGRPIDEIRLGITRAARESGASVRRYSDLTDHEITELTGLSTEAVGRSRKRMWTEPVTIDGRASAFGEALAADGLRLIQGSRSWTVTGDHDKGTGVAYLRDRFRWGPVFAIGDDPNDRSMFDAVDVALLVERPGGGWADVHVGGLRRVEGIGPEGWARAAGLVLADVS